MQTGIADWKAMDDFAAGIDTNRLPTTDLAGQRWVLAQAGGPPVELCFRSADQLDWSEGTAAGIDGYEAVEVAAGTYFLARTLADRPYDSQVTVVHLPTARTITVTSTIAAEPVPGVPRVSQVFASGTVDIGDGRPIRGTEPGPTRDLIGWRALYRYSPNHLYEHVYLNAQRYCWQCLVGEQRGHGDVDLATTWKLAPQLYVFTFREFRIPVAATWCYNLDTMRSTGRFFGLAGDGTVRSAPGGAYITSLGRAEYPDDGGPV